MSKAIGVLLLIFGVIWLLLSAWVVYKWSQGDYVVHEMTYEQFVDGHSAMDEFSFVKITGGRIDVPQTVRTSLQVGKPSDQKEYFGRVFSPYVGSDLLVRGIAIEIKSDEVDEVVPSLTDSSVTDRYLPLVVEGYFSYGAGNELMENAFSKLGMDYDTGVVVMHGVEPTSVFRRIRGVVVSLVLILAGMGLLKKKA